MRLPRLLDRWPRGREGFILALATAVVAALLGTAAAIYAWSDPAPDEPATAAPQPSGEPLVPVVSQAGEFVVSIHAELVGDELERGAKFATQDGDIVITVGKTGTQGLKTGHRSALEALRSAYPELRVEREIDTRLGELRGQRSVGLLRRARGDTLVVSVTTGVDRRRTWSVVLFATRDVDPTRLERFYQPVLDSFRPLQ